jgi:hypothetical protein
MNDMPMKKIVLKVSIDLSCKLSTLVVLRRQLARILGITPAGLRLVAVEEDCVITFQLVGALANSELIFCGDKAGIFTRDKLWKLQALLIQWLKCGEFEWDLTTGGYFPLYKREVLIENYSVKLNYFACNSLIILAKRCC